MKQQVHLTDMKATSKTIQNMGTEYNTGKMIGNMLDTLRSIKQMDLVFYRMSLTVNMKGMKETLKTIPKMETEHFTGKNGRKYVGQFENNQTNGFGILTYEANSEYDRYEL